MRWVFLFIIFLACVAICWSRGRNAPSELSANINYPDRSEGDECGRIRIQVRRNTGPFRRLIKYFTSRVSSSRSDDLYMTSRLKLILDRLIQSLDDDSDIIDIVRGWSEDIDQADRLNLRYEGNWICLIFMIIHSIRCSATMLLQRHLISQCYSLDCHSRIISFLLSTLLRMRWLL